MDTRRFPPDFMFQMMKEDIEEWKSQIVISNSIKRGLRGWQATEDGKVYGTSCHGPVP